MFADKSSEYFTEPAPPARVGDRAAISSLRSFRDLATLSADPMSLSKDILYGLTVDFLILNFKFKF